MNSKIVHNIWCFSLFLIFNLYYRRWYFILQATCIPTLPIAYIGQFACFIPSSPGPEVWNATGHHPPVGNSHGHRCTPYTRLKVTSPGHSSLCITTTPSLKCYGVSYQYSSTPCPYQCELSFYNQWEEYFTHPCYTLNWWSADISIHLETVCSFITGWHSGCR